MQRGNLKEKKVEWAEKSLSRMDGIDINKLKARKCKLNYFFFIQEFWDVIIKDKPVWNWHIPMLCKELQAIIERVGENKPKLHDLIVNIPPGTTKSLICSVFPMAWAWTKYPWLRFIKATHSSPLSLELAELTRLIIQSDKYLQYFPHLRVRRGSDAKSNFRMTYWDKGMWTFGGSLYSTSIDATVTGFHGHIRLTDDPLDPEKAISTLQLEKANRWIDTTYSSRVTDKVNTPHILIMQRVHRKDPTGVALEKVKKGKKIKQICLPGRIKTKKQGALVQPQSLLPQYMKRKGFLDPIRLSEEALLDMELNLGQYSYLSQVMQDPKTAGSGMFEVSKFIMIDGNTFNFPAHVLRIVRYWDKAGTQDGGAYTAGVKIAALKNGRYMIMDVVRGQWGATKREQIIEDTAIQDGKNVKIFIEQEPGSGGKESAESTIARLKGKGFACLRDLPTGDKVYRADPFSVAVNRSLVLMITAEWNEAYKEESEDFPNSDYMDQVDASSGAYAKLAIGKVAGVWGRS